MHVSPLSLLYASVTIQRREEEKSNINTDFNANSVRVPLHASLFSGDSLFL